MCCVWASTKKINTRRASIHAREFTIPTDSRCARVGHECSRSLPSAGRWYCTEGIKRRPSRRCLALPRFSLSRVVSSLDAAVRSEMCSAVVHWVFFFCIPSYHSLFLGKEVSRRLVMTCIIPLLLAMYHYLRLLDVTRLVV